MPYRHGDGNGVAASSYFVPVANAGSLTVAAEESLRTSEPSLSRKIRHLENKVGAQLLTRSASVTKKAH